MVWGWSLLVNGTAGSGIDSKENIVAFVGELIETIGMEAFGECWCERFATHDPLKSGYSFSQMITTSSIVGHFVDLNGDFYIDIFSCKEFNPDLVCLVVNKYFRPVGIESTLILRG